MGELHENKYSYIFKTDTDTIPSGIKFQSYYPHSYSFFQHFIIIEPFRSELVAHFKVFALSISEREGGTTQKSFAGNYSGMSSKKQLLKNFVHFLISQVEGYIDDHAFLSQGSSMVEKRSFNQPGGLVM
jgi:hypothetical protein